MEERRAKRTAFVRAAEVTESEIAFARRGFGRRPSLVASRAEENFVLEDLRRGVMEGGSLEGEIEGGSLGGFKVGTGVTVLSLFVVLVLLSLFVLLVVEVALVFWELEGAEGGLIGALSGGGEGMMGGYVGVQRSIAGGGGGRVAVDSQLGGESGFKEIVVPGRRSVGCSSRCSMNVTWKESKIRPETLSHSR